MEDPTPARPAPGEYGGPLHSTELWLGLLVIVCAVIVLVLQRRRAATLQSSALAPQAPSTPAPIAQADGHAELEDLGLDREFAALAGQAAVALRTEGAIAGGEVHSHKRLRRHPELAATNGKVSDADV